MAAGKYRHRLTLQAVSVTDTVGDGTKSRAWSDQFKIWASQLSDRASEPVVAGQPRSVVRYLFETPYRTDITAPMRMLWRHQALELTAVKDPDGRQRRLHLDATLLPLSDGAWAVPEAFDSAFDTGVA